MSRRRQSPIQKIPELNPLHCDKCRLSPREQQVLELIGKGKTTKEVAVMLSLSTGTIGNHRKSICRKLNIHSTAELVYRAALCNR